MRRSNDLASAIDTYNRALDLLNEARMAGAPPDCLAERMLDLEAARVLLIELERNSGNSGAVIECE